MNASTVNWPKRVRQIAAMDDEPILRNLLITQTYHDLSQATAEIIGAGNATWATYGCWASKTAGPFIRGEEVPKAFRSILASSTAVRQQVRGTHSALQDVKDTIESPMDAVLGTADRISEDVTLYIMQGNKVVFQEVGGAFADFIEAFRDQPPTKKALEALLARYEIGQVKPDTVSVNVEKRAVTSRRQGGQSLLRSMLQNYYLAITEDDPAQKAQLIMLGSAQGGVHEQTRLQNYIMGSLDAPIDVLLRDVVHDHATKRTRSHSVLHDIASAVDRMVHPLASSVKVLWRAFSTHELMKMKLPDGTLKLGEDVPAPPGGPLFPRALTTIRLPELRSVLEQFDALSARGTEKKGIIGRLEADLSKLAHRGILHREATGSAAHDWSNLTQRMRFILEYFRSRQQDPVLFDQPFSSRQQEAIEAGKVPGGPL